MEGGTKLCIRDALYRLARSAMKRQASSGERAIGGEAGSSSSEDADATSTGLEGSINSDPSSSSRVSRYPFFPLAHISDVHGDESQCYLYNSMTFGCIIEACQTSISSRKLRSNFHCGIAE